MKFFDLHCDTAGECYLQKKSLASSNLHISLDKIPKLESYTQFFAIWMPDELRGEAAVGYFNCAAEYYEAQLAENERTISEKHLTPVLAVEGGSVIGGEPDALETLYNRGVRLLTLTWNASNELGCGCSVECGGLTDTGKASVRRMNGLGITVDVSHLNADGFKDVVAISDKPFIASHSNLDIVDTAEGHRRNLAEWQAREIIGAGGLIGLNFYNLFLQNLGESCFEAVYRQLEAFDSLGAGRVLAIGSDFDGCEIAPELAGIDKIPSLYSYLHSKGVGTSFLDDVFYNNAAAFFERTQVL